MSLVEFIGFLVVVGSLAFSLLQKMWLEYMRRQHPEQYAERKREEEARLKDMFNQMDVGQQQDEEEERRVSPPPFDCNCPRKGKKGHKEERPSHRLLSDEFKYDTKIEHFKQQTRIEDRKFDNTRVGMKFQGNYGQDLVSQDMRVKQALPTVKQDSSTIRTRLRDMGLKKQLVIFSEIIGEPKSFKD